MSKVIMFLSIPKDTEGKTKEELEIEYDAPHGESIKGINSSDAPIKYLLREDPEIDTILCIVSPESKREGLELFRELVGEASKSVKVKPIDFDADSFEKFGVREILAGLDKGDEVWLETTGGFRNTGYYLFLIANIMRYMGVEIKGAIYGNLHAERIENVTELFNIFELSNGVNEFVKFGSSRKLADYYKDAPEIREFFEAAEDLRQAMTLCKIREIDSKINKFNKQYRNIGKLTETDSLLRKLLPLFGEKFNAVNNKSKQKPFTIVDIIEWCVSNGLIQQALTLYTEKMPEYILTKKLGLNSEIKPEDILNRRGISKKEYEDAYVLVFIKDLLARDRVSDFMLELRNTASIIAKARDAEHCVQLLNEKGVSYQYMKPIEMIVSLRNIEYGFYNQKCEQGTKCVGFAESIGMCAGCRNKKETAEALKAKAEYNVRKFYEVFDEQILQEFFGKNTVQEFADSLQHAPLRILNYFYFGAPIEKSENYKLEDIISNLDAYLSRRPYYVKRSGCGNLKGIIVDYYHMKILRNQINHANEEDKSEGNSEGSIQDVLRAENRVFNMNEMTLEDVSRCILDALQSFK